MPPAPEDTAGSGAVPASAAETSPSPDAMAKYHAAADAANRALTAVVAGCVPGAAVLDLCRLGDATIIEFTKSAFAKSKDILKGIAFPTCVSSGSAICHVSPIEQDASSIPPLADGDCVRVELAAHVDGYIAHAAHTLVIGASTESPATGRKADVLAAGHACLDVALRLLRPGKTNWEVTEVIEKTASEFGCKPVQGMMAHQLDQNVLEGKKRIVMNPTAQHRKETETETIEAGDVFSLDILVSTGDGIPRNVETHRTTIFRKLPDASYALKTASARGVFAAIKKDFGDMGFSLRQFVGTELGESKARLGLVECLKHDLLTPYRVAYEREGEHTAHFIATVVITPTGPVVLTASHWDPTKVASEKSISLPELKAILSSPIRDGAAKNPKKKKKKAQTDGQAA